jgi:hypothetical protein
MGFVVEWTEEEAVAGSKSEHRVEVEGLLREAYRQVALRRMLKTLDA